MPFTFPAYIKMSGKIVVPEWYTNYSTHSSTHLRSVLSALSSRERTRHNLQYASLNSIPASTTAPSSKSTTSKRGISSHLPKVPLWSSNSRERSEEDYYSVREGGLIRHIQDDPNRYMDILPYDVSRVKVGTGVEIGSNDGGNARYLNASWVRELEGGAWWVAAQAPLPHTIHAFLSLFTSLQPTSERLHTIVQLTPQVEKGVWKADQYFPGRVTDPPMVFYPETVNAHLKLPTIQVELLRTERIVEADCVVSTLRLTLLYPPQSHPSANTNEGSATGQSFDVRHVQYNAWPDHGVPSNPRQLLALNQVSSRLNGVPSASSSASMQTEPLSTPPILCHCSAGVGRTGTFIAIASLLRSLGALPAATQYQSTSPPGFLATYRGPETSPLGALPSSVRTDAVAREVDALREQRTTMVQKPEQVKLIYDVLGEVFKGGPTSK